MDAIGWLANLSTAVTARVLRNLADALDTPPAVEPVPPTVMFLTINNAPSRLFGRKEKPC